MILNSPRWNVWREGSISAETSNWNSIPHRKTRLLFSSYKPQVHNLTRWYHTYIYSDNLYLSPTSKWQADRSHFTSTLIRLLNEFCICLGSHLPENHPTFAVRAPPWFDLTQTYAMNNTTTLYCLHIFPGHQQLGIILVISLTLSASVEKVMQIVEAILQSRQMQRVCASLEIPWKYWNIEHISGRK